MVTVKDLSKSQWKTATDMMERQLLAMAQENLHLELAPSGKGQVRHVTAVAKHCWTFPSDCLANRSLRKAEWIKVYSISLGPKHFISISFNKLVLVKKLCLKCLESSV